MVVRPGVRCAEFYDKIRILVDEGEERFVPRSEIDIVKNLMDAAGGGSPFFEEYETTLCIGIFSSDAVYTHKSIVEVGLTNRLDKYIRARK